MSGKSKTVYPDGMTKEQYAQNQSDIKRQNLENETEMRTLMYNTGRAGSISAAQYANMERVNEQMTTEMVEAQTLMSNYENQERRRLFQAKKGTGQVGDEDTAITSEMYENAKGLLKRGTEGWEGQRQEAMNVGDGGWSHKSGSLEDYIAKGAYNTKSREAGAEYEGGGNLGNTNVLGDETDFWNRGL